jgi:hypothetical protein
MVQLIDYFENLGFILQDDGTYTGYGIKSDDLIAFEFKSHYLNCYQGEILLFSIIYGELKVETLLVLLVEFGIIEKTVKN